MPEGATPISPVADAVGDRYRFEREIGAGGMATVFLATDLKHDRPVAIKVLRGGETGVDAERFHREIRVLARLRHPFILPLHDSGEAAGALFFVTPFAAIRSSAPSSASRGDTTKRSGHSHGSSSAASAPRFTCGR